MLMIVAAVTLRSQLWRLDEASSGEAAAA
jgi:hypothetical protein